MADNEQKPLFEETMPVGGAAPNVSEWDTVPRSPDGRPVITINKPAFEETDPVDTSKSLVQKAFEPITSYPGTYSEMNREAREQMARGAGQISGAFEKPSLSEGAWEAAKGIANVGFGGLGYTASPISAAYRTLLGKPVEEITGIPKEITEFAASLATPGIGFTRFPHFKTSPPPPATEAQKIVNAAERIGLEIPKAAVAGPTWQTVAGAVKEIPIIGAPIVKSSKKSLSDIENAVQETASKYGALGVEDAGRVAKEAIEGWVSSKGESGRILDRLYDKVDNFVDPLYTRQLDSTADTISKIMAERANAKMSGRSPAVDEVLNAVQSAEGMNYEGLKKLRSYIGKMTPEQMVAKNIDQTEAKRIYAALSDDLKKTILVAGSEEATKMFDYASSVARIIADKREQLSKIIGTKADAAPEKVISRIESMATGKSSADIQKLRDVKHAIGDDAWNEVAGTILNKMGRTAEDATFSGDRFVTKFDNLSFNARNLLFGSNPELYQSVKDLADVSKSFKSLNKLGNPSGTGRVASLLSGIFGGGAVTAGILAEPVTTIVSLITSLAPSIGVAKYMASPAKVKQASAFGKAYNNAMFNPTANNLVVLDTASRAFNKTLEDTQEDQPRATGGSVFDKMHMARKRAEGGGTDAPFNEWDAVPRNAEGIPQIRIEKPPVNEADEAQAAREAAAARVAGNVRGAPYEPTPPSTEGKTWMMEPGKEAVQSGNYEMPPNVRLDDADIPYNVETGKKLQMVRRPSNLPWTRTPDGVRWAMPKIAELAGDILNPLAVTKGVALKPGEFALGSGPIKRSVLEQPNAPTFYSALDRAVADIPQAKASAEQWAATLANRPGVKPEEIQWRGLDQYLAGRAGQTVTKQEIADHLAGNKVEFGSVVKGGKEPFDAKRLSQLESEYSSLKQHPIDDPSFGEAKYDELIRLMNIRDQSTTDTLYSAAEQAMRNGQRAQQRGDKIAADRYFKEHEMLNTRAEKLDLEGLGLANPPKYSGYQLPGGENYSEKLLTLPNQWEAPRAAQVANEAKIKALRQEMHGTSGTNEIRAEIRSLQDANAALQKQISASPIYKSPHWDEPNPVTHMRTNERTIGNTSSHHIEEVQSDWHQKGRTEGYADPDPAKRDIAARELLTAESELKKQIRRSDQSHYKEAIDNQVEFHANPERDVEFAEQWFGPEQQSAALRYMAAKREFSALAGGVPDAPFKKTWPDLTMKQALRDAVEGGKDRLSWTPGEAQAKRYDLSQHVKEIEYIKNSDGTYRVGIADKDGEPIRSLPGIDVNRMTMAQIEATVGKEVAVKIENRAGRRYRGHDGHTLEGLDLKVGGEGMNEFYDKMLPKAVEKLGKAYGVKVQRGVDTTGNPVNYVDIPPAWKQEILKKGFPLFAAGGSVFDKMKRASK